MVYIAQCLTSQHIHCEPLEFSMQTSGWFSYIRQKCHFVIKPFVGYILGLRTSIRASVYRGDLGLY